MQPMTWRERNQGLAPVEREELGLDWMRRLLALRRAGRIRPVFVECGHWYIGRYEVSSWNDKDHISHAALRLLIQRLESRDSWEPIPERVSKWEQIERMPVRSEMTLHREARTA